MRPILWLYVLFAVVGATLLEYRAQTRRAFPCPAAAVLCSTTAPPVDYVAARTLPAAHRVRPTDLVEPTGLSPTLRAFLPSLSVLSGAYVGGEILEGAPIIPATLRPRPGLAAGRRVVALPLTAQPELVNVLDVGWRVDVCADKQCPVRDRLLLAVDCVDRTGKSCAAIVEITVEDERALREFAAKRELKVVGGFAERW